MHIVNGINGCWNKANTISTHRFHIHSHTERDIFLIYLSSSADAFEFEAADDNVLFSSIFALQLPPFTELYIIKISLQWRIFRMLTTETVW